MESGNLTTWPRAMAAKGTARKMEERMMFVSNICPVTVEAMRVDSQNI